MLRFSSSLLVVALLGVCGCDGDGGNDDGGRETDGGGRADGGPRDAGPPRDAPPPTAASCDPGTSPTATPAEPELLATLFDRYHEAWLASPGVADLDGDGENEIVIARAGLVLVFHIDGTVVWRFEVDERIWASPVIADLTDSPGLEVAFSSRGDIHLLTATGDEAPGFPFTWRDELRSLAAGDLDGDGRLELAAVTSSPLDGEPARDIVIAIHADGAIVDGFPPITTSAAGCDDACYTTGGYDQNIAIGDVTGDGRPELFLTQDNAYLSLHEGNGRALDAADIFEDRTKFLGVRFLHDYALAQQGYADDEDSANQAHFTNSAPAIADIDGDGTNELIVLGSVQNASQDDRFRGVGLWALRPDGTRHPDWIEPFHAPDYLAGLWDFDGTNVVGATNQVSVADVLADRDGLEMVFAGFDGAIHLVDATSAEVWSTPYTTSDRILTGGVVIGDLSADGVPEIVFATYSPDEGVSELIVMNANGGIVHRVDLPERGAMAVPTLADVDGDGDIEIVVNLKDAVDRERSALVFTVPGSETNCLLWPTGRRDDLRDGLVP